MARSRKQVISVAELQERLASRHGIEKSFDELRMSTEKYGSVTMCYVNCETAKKRKQVEWDLQIFSGLQKEYWPGSPVVAIRVKHTGLKYRNNEHPIAPARTAKPVDPNKLRDELQGFSYRMVLDTMKSAAGKMRLYRGNVEVATISMSNGIVRSKSLSDYDKSDLKVAVKRARKDS